jgi:hypothetical protein
MARSARSTILSPTPLPRLREEIVQTPPTRIVDKELSLARGP